MTTVVLIRQGRFECAHRETLARTVSNVCTGGCAMTIYVAFRDFVAVLKKTSQSDERFHLPAGRHIAIEITHEADTDTFCIGPVVGSSATMRTCELSSPAVSRLNLAIGAVCAVTDDEVITNSLPVIAFAVPFIENGSASFSGCRVMDDYRRPRSVGA